ncbi:acyl-CoA dehydrogenase family protein [Benzoatithermus flavus]|uniref:Acyl-CoA dehydrogenase family protein n=1 Tax=Benzoatithermus flavus TaxID=3108223 RepID=A0ABU8XMF2_9PROT
MRTLAELTGGNLYRSDPDLVRRLERGSAPTLDGRDRERLERFGAFVAETVEPAAAYTDRYAPPRLEPWDGEGRPIDRIVRNPLHAAAHAEVYRHGFVALNHVPERRPYRLTFAFGYLLAQADISLHCPATLTGAVAWVLDRHAPEELRRRFLPAFLRTDGTAATGATWATEVGAGSDLGATATVARRTDGEDVGLTGLKWFASNADADMALVTARPEGAPAGSAGIGLYLVPRRLPDGSLNRYRIRALKEKLGTRGLATGEIELDGAGAWQVAAPPEGLKAMLDAFGYSRIHNAMAAAGLQRRVFLEALAHARGREAFGHPLATYPMVQDVLLDLLARQEASLLLALEAAAAFDAALADPAAKPWLRLVTALAKFQTATWVVPAASALVELMGGRGYVEDHPASRLLRDAQVLPVWEGGANIQAHEVLRLLSAGNAAAAYAARLEGVLGRLEGGLGDLARPVAEALAACRRVAAGLAARPEEGSRIARRLARVMAEALAAALLLEAAAADLAAGDARKALVARRFVEGCRERPWDLVGGEGPWQRCFAAIVDHAPIAASLLAA